jgi:acyl-CoA synthetase (NDP forming)
MVEAIDGLGRQVPVLTCFMSARGVPDELRGSHARIPSYAYPEQAAIALAHATDYGTWRAKPEGREADSVGIREDEAHAVIAAALERGEESWLTPDEVSALLDCYGLSRVREATAATPEEAADVAARFGTRVALKAAGPVHKTESDAVRLDLPPGRVLDEARAMAERLEETGEQLDGFVVQEMIHGGTEMLVGAAADPVFGPVIAVGAGGVTVELTRDVAVRVAPLTDLDAEEMVRGLATFPLLDGFRGAPKKDVAALVEVILRLSQLADRHPEVVEMDCNPVMVLERGAAVVDARVKVRLPAPAPPFAARAGQ